MKKQMNKLHGLVIDRTGEVYGRLTAIEIADEKIGIGRSYAWVCKCVCGNYKNVNGSDLTSGRVQSCGCMNDENREKAWKANKKYFTDEEKLTAKRLKNRKARLKFHYSMTIQDWDDMFEKQGGKCAICGTHQAQLKDTLNVDHDHETGKVRGLLCAYCNTSLTFFERYAKESQEYLAEAFEDEEDEVEVEDLSEQEQSEVRS